MIHVATGLYDCAHSCWNPPPHPMGNLLCLRISCLFSEVTSRDVLLVLFFISYQSPDFGSDIIWETERLNMFSKSLGSYIFFGKDHQLEVRLKDEQTHNKNCSRSGFAGTKHSTQGKICTAFDKSKNKCGQSGQDVLIWITQERV